MKLPDSVERVNRLLKGEKVVCPKCHKGVYKPVGEDYKSTHSFECDHCGSRIILN